MTQNCGHTLDAVAQEFSVETCRDADEWDRVVASLGGAIYQSWGWGESRERTQGWRPCRLYLRRGDEMLAAMQVLSRGIPMTGLRLLCAPGGIACAAPDSAVLSSLAAWLRDYIRKERGVLLRLDSKHAASDIEANAALCSAGFSHLKDLWCVWGINGRATMDLDLRKSEGQLLSAMSKTHRQAINRAADQGIVTEVTGAEDAVEVLYDCLRSSAKRVGFHVYDAAYYRTIFRCLSPRCAPTILIARYRDQPAGALFCARFGNRYYNLFAGHKAEFGEFSGMKALQWRAIQAARNEGCDFYDFLHLAANRIPEAGERGYGLYRFKAGFGAEWRYSAGYFDLYTNPPLYRAFRIAERKAGPWVYRVARRASSLLQEIISRRKV